MIRSIIIFFIILTNVSFAEIKKVNIVGNARVSSATIESLVDKNGLVHGPSAIGIGYEEQWKTGGIPKGLEKYVK